MRKALADFMGVSYALMGNSPYATRNCFGKQKSNNYTNKNANVRYYIDEKGNIRRVKL